MSNPCYTCRRRHIQCDRSSIPCAKCQKAGLECLDKRPLRWVRGVAVRGHMQGISIENAAARAVVARAGQMSLPAGLGDTLMAGLDHVSRFYLDYYNERICKLFIVYDSDKNPFRSLIPLSLTDPILLKAVLALAAQHKANESSSGHLTDAHHNALAYKHQAIHGLSQAVQDVSLCRKDTTVASIFLLIFLDLLESGSDRWNVHIEGAKSLITLLNQPLGPGDDPGQMVQELRNFIAKQIYQIETLGATFVRPRLFSQIAAPGMQPQDTLEQSFLGCPEYLLKAIQYFSHQRDAIVGLGADTNIDIPSQIQDLTTTLDSIQNFDCHLWASNLPHRSPTHDTHHLSALSTAYKLGAQIYGQRVLDALTNETSPQDTLVDELLRVIASLRDDPFLFKCILWPMCIAAVECPRHAQTQRWFLTECLEKFWQDTKCLNAVNATRILQRYWEWEWEGEGGKEGRWIFDIGGLEGVWLLV